MPSGAARGLALARCTCPTCSELPWMAYAITCPAPADSAPLKTYSAAASHLASFSLARATFLGVQDFGQQKPGAKIFSDVSPLIELEQQSQ